MVEPRGGGGSGAVVLAVALLAGFLFIGGAAAIYLSNPPGSADPTDIAFASGSPTLPPFVQPTATPGPTQTATFILLPSDSPSFSPFPTSSIVGPTAPPTGPPIHTPRPTDPPGGPTPTPAAVVAKFTCSQVGDKKIQCQEHATGNVTGWHWTFGDGQESNERNPSNTYSSYGNKTVTLTVTGPNGAADTKSKDIFLNSPATPTPSQGPTAPPTPTAEPTQTPEATQTAATTAAAASDGPTPGGSSAP
ncbi:MAG: large repetitive protein [Chloroflexota bacterium]|nr:large repetitive protein [Chloroflexota bacterium]